VREGSSLSFTGTIEDAPFTGVFEAFTATVRFDPADPAAGSIDAKVEVKSVDSRNRERDEYMLAKDFFYARKHPVATFSTTAIRAAAAGAFVADAELTLRGVTRPVQMRFTFSDGAPARLEGAVELERLAFGVGQGEWRDTRQIGNEVSVAITLVLAPAVP
jgi:polyisoprenoid-binding protein YceI